MMSSLQQVIRLHSCKRDAEQHRKVNLNVLNIATSAARMAACKAPEYLMYYITFKVALPVSGLGIIRIFNLIYIIIVFYASTF